MQDFRPVGATLGPLLFWLGAAMLLPMAADLVAGEANWRAFAVAALVTMVAGAALERGCASDGRGAGMTIPQTFLLTAAIWVVGPAFGALPFVFGAPGAGFTDAYFEATSGFTTAGATVFAKLETLPPGVLLWRQIMHWLGGIGIIVVALAILPALRIGGMQLFRSESFDTMGKVLPRATEIAASVSWVYVALTGLCAVAYAACGMTLFDAATHAMSTVATGGFANYDASFGGFPPAAEYVAVVFMTLACLPFVRIVQFAAGTAQPLLRDTQVHAYLGFTAVFVLGVFLWRLAEGHGDVEPVFRRTLFNVVSILTGTGFASEDYSLWGAFPAAMLFIGGLVGGCSGSATCAIKVFRFQVLAAAIRAQVQAIHSPNGVFLPRFQGRPIDDEVLSSVMAFFYMFALTLGVVTVALAMMGLDPVTAISAAAASLACVGPGFGPIVGPAGNYAPLPDAAKWLLAVTMIMGRLELLGFLVLFTRAFWRS
jgi:trk system potassium uptake protein TrkH